MKTRRKPAHRRANATPLFAYTAFDEMMASPTEPAPTGTHEAGIVGAVRALGAMTSPETASAAHWSVCCMVGNVVETMLQQGLVQDPDGLLQDAFDALKAAAAAAESGAPLLLTGDALTTVEHMMTDWAIVLKTAPARSVIRAFRATATRTKDIAAGRLQPRDYTTRFSTSKDCV